jgi:AmmeMemoRadiSam system protein B
MTTPKLRRMAVAGSWYPADRALLAREVNRYLDVAESQVPVAGDLRAIIAPHAGLKYSGPIAGHAYATLAGRSFDVAVLVGPSHFVAFDGVAIYEDGAFETPEGPIPIDERCAAAIALASDTVHEHPTAHVREHCLEMQMPFLAQVLPGTPIVPLVIGHQRRKTIYDLADAIVAGVDGRSAVLIASSDLSHYQNAGVAARLDAKVLKHVERFDADGLMDSLEAYPEHACGGGAMVAVMLAARALGAREGRVLKYGDSGDVSGDKDAVVGYVAAAFGSFT